MSDTPQNPADGRRERKDRRTQKKSLLSKIFPAIPGKDRRGFAVLREAEVLDIYVPPLKGEKNRRTTPTRRNTPR